jgi:hypothetical protein
LSRAIWGNAREPRPNKTTYRCYGNRRPPARRRRGRSNAAGRDLHRCDLGRPRWGEGIGYRARRVAAFLTQQMIPFFRIYGYDYEVAREKERQGDGRQQKVRKQRHETSTKLLKTNDSAKWLIQRYQVNQRLRGPFAKRFISPDEICSFVSRRGRTGWSREFGVASDSEMAPQPVEIPQNGLGNGTGRCHPFAAAAGSGVSASRTMSLSATSFASSASRSGSAIRPRVEAIQRCWTAIAFSAIRRPASVR